MSRLRHGLQVLALGAAVLAAPAVRAAAPVTPPAPARFVTDQAQFLSPATADALDRRLTDYQRGTGHQVLLWIGRTTGGEPIETWAVRTFAAWRVGRQGSDDGVVLFVMADDRKLRIEVGYGLEGQLPDIKAAQIIRERIAPRLQAGDRDGAAQAGVAAILDALGGAGAPAADVPAEGKPQAHLGLGELIVLGILGLFVLWFIVTHPGLALLLLTNMGSGSRSGGGWGGGGGGGGFSGGGGRSGGGGASGSW